MTKLRALGLFVFAPTRGQNAKSVGSFGLLQMACTVLALCLASSVAAPAQTFNTPASVSPAEKSAAGLSSLPSDAQWPISAALGKDDSGYWVHRSGEGLRGENPRQALVAEFTKQGTEIRSHNLRWSLETRGYGYGNALHPVKAVAPQANANRVEYRWDGVTEWYENGPLGLEQGFTLPRRPGKANGQPLTMELRLRGDLVAALDPGGKALELRGKDGKAALRYTGLSARDVTGRELRSWLEVRGERLLVRFEDRGARYPVVVDPWIQQAELTASDGAVRDWFGSSVALDANAGTAVAGAPQHACCEPGPGAAYVFVESGGTWSQQAELTPSDGVDGDNFGYSVAISGSTAVVGAPLHPCCEPVPGAAYVFARSGTTWSQQAELTPSDGVYGDNFGHSVAISGSTAVVGAYGHYAGAAYVFAQNGTTWSQQAELTPSDGRYNDGFGYSVAVDANAGTVVAGAPWHPYSYDSGAGPGATYVFVQNGTTWSQQAELTASDGAAYDGFGRSVAVSGSTAVVGAPSHTVGSNQNQGAAYVFVQAGTTWSQQAELTASDGGADDGFGYSVAVDANAGTVVAGSPWHTVGSNPWQGSAYVFVQNGTTWGQQAELTASDSVAYDELGISAAISGSMVVAGAPDHAVGSNYQQGAAYVFGSSGPLYTLSASPSSLSLVQGTQGISTITITPFNGFSGGVSFSARGLPSGVTAAFNPNPAASTSTLTLTASETATTGSATVLVVGTSGNLTQTTPLALTVTGVTTVSLSPASLSFGNEVVNTTSKAKSVTVKNVGTATLDIGSIAIALGTNFAISNNTCEATLAVNKTCKVSVTFTPTGLRAFSDTLIFTDNASGNPQTVALSGTGKSPATLTPSGYNFKTTQVGDTSAAHEFTLKNNLPTTLTGISYSTLAPFAVSASTCGTTLDSKKTCTISVTFSPTEAGTATGTLSVTDSANNSPQTASLSGTGD